MRGSITFLQGALNNLKTILYNNKKCKQFTGISLNLFNTILNSLKAKGKFKSSYKMGPEDQLCLFYFKVKINATNGICATVFGVEEQLISMIFKHMVDILFEHARQRLWWLSRAEVKRTMPKSFRKHFPDIRVIIDATEIRTQIPKGVRPAVLKYSSYKHYHSIKVLIGIGN